MKSGDIEARTCKLAAAYGWQMYWANIWTSVSTSVWSVWKEGFGFDDIYRGGLFDI